MVDALGGYKAGQGGDPYNGTGSRAILRRPAAASAVLPVRK